MNPFPWDGSSLVDEVYSNSKNCKIIDTKVQNDKVIIFVSGNGLYYPNNSETFKRTVIDNDRYEWDYIGLHPLIQKHYEKIIFVRDIYKQWYVKGINAEINSVDKVVEYFGRMLTGKKITICGVSAGGYFASLLGIKLGAEKIFNISGQWVLVAGHENGPLVAEGNNSPEERKYFDLRNVFNSSREYPDVFYLYPCRCEQDIEQERLISNLKICRFAVDTDVHGSLLRNEIWPHLFILDRRKWQLLNKKAEGKQVGDEFFFRRVVPWYYRVVYRGKHLYRILLKK